MISGKSLGATTIEDKAIGNQAVILASSHNYVGFYRITEQCEQVHKLALDRLPVASPQLPQAMCEAFHAALATVFQADFCYTTSTGYGSNLLAFQAILRPGWLCIMDAKSHNSMHVGAYLSDANKIFKYRHNDMSHLEKLLDENHGRYEHVLVAVEALFSMDGTIPPLDALARLKKRHGFILLVDEAHSLLSIGKTGQGCVELWNDTHPEAAVDDHLVDVRTAVLSKSLGAIGGMVCGKREFRSVVEARWEGMQRNGSDPVLAATMVQCLYVLGQPTLLRRRLSRMRQMCQWARSELNRFGVHIYGDATTPLLPIHVGRPSTAAKLSFKLRKHGVLATPVSIPAVPFWEARVRVCLSADHTDAQLNTLVRTIIHDAQEIGIIPRTELEAQIFETIAVETQVDEEASETLESCRHIERLIEQDACLQEPTSSPQVRQAGHQARHRYGIAAGGARWISGTFSVHIETEKLIGETLKLQAALSYSDNYLGLLSTISALCRPLLKRKTHRFFLPKDCPHAIPDGIKAAPRRTCPRTTCYSSINDLETLLTTTCDKQDQVTVYLSTSCLGPRAGFKDAARYRKDVASCLENFAARVKLFKTLRNNLTIVLHDTEFGLSGVVGRNLLLGVIDKLHQITKNLLVYGDFMSSFGVPGAYLAGSQQLVEELRYSSRGYMFTTASLPFAMGIVKHGLEYPSEEEK